VWPEDTLYFTSQGLIIRLNLKGLRVCIEVTVSVKKVKSIIRETGFFFHWRTFTSVTHPRHHRTVSCVNHPHVHSPHATLCTCHTCHPQTSSPSAAQHPIFESLFHAIKSHPHFINSCQTVAPHHHHPSLLCSHPDPNYPTAEEGEMPHAQPHWKCLYVPLATKDGHSPQQNSTPLLCPEHTTRTHFPPLRVPASSPPCWPHSTHLSFPVSAPLSAVIATPAQLSVR
jgi:hypothetical protein